MHSRLTLVWGLLSTLTICSLAGCSTHAQRIRAAREAFYSGQLATASQSLETHMQQYRRDADATALDLAIVQLLDGKPTDAEETLRRVRDDLDYLEQQDIVEAGVSMLTDDQRLAYSGEDYEKTLTRLFLALASLLDDGQDAEAYSLQINAKQQELLQRALDQQKEGADLAYTPLAIGPYLRGVIRESTFGNYDDASRAYHQVVSWQPGFQAGRVDLARAENGIHSRPGHGVLYLFALVDRGPVKEEAVEIPTSAALLIADRIVSAVGKYDVPPTLAPIKVPRVVVPPRKVDSISVVVDGQEAGRTETICDIADLALRQQEVEMPHIMARAVARRIVKKSAIYATKDFVEADSPLPDLALSAVGVVWEATEAADTRCWGLLPREIQVIRVELPAGRHDVQLRPVLGNRPLSTGETVAVDIANGRNTYMLGYFPGPSAVGQILQRTQ